MAICSAYYKTETLYRGQTRHFDAIVSSGWRDLWSTRGEIARDLYTGASDFVTGKIGSVKLEKHLASVALRSKDGPTLYGFLRLPGGCQAVVALLTHIRDSVGPGQRLAVALYELGMLEHSFFARYQGYLFNDTRDTFVARFVPRTLRELAGALFDFYDAQRDSFDIEFRITQVALDFMGILQHYGVVGTPGLDLTDDLDVALWFATHNGKTGYSLLPVAEWGVVYEVRAPVVIFSPNPVRDAVPVDDLQAGTAINLASISPLFTRITRQHGWYAIHARAWELMFDYTECFSITRKRAVDYGAPSEIVRRFEAKGLSPDYLFPPREEDPFKAHLERSGLKTFY